MAVSTTDTYSGPYIANGVTVAFPFTFKAVSADDVAVIIRTPSAPDTVLAPSLYSVSLAAQGGSVTLYTPPLSGELFVLSEPSFLQSVNFSSGQPFLPSVVNEVNDRDVTRALYLRREAARGIKAPLGEDGATIPPLAERAGKIALFGFDGSISAIDTLNVANSELTDDGLWNAADDIIDDGEWG